MISATVRNARSAVSLSGAEAATGPVIALLHTHLAGAVAAKSERLIAVGPDYPVDGADIPATEPAATSTTPRSSAGRLEHLLCWRPHPGGGGGSARRR